MENPEFFREIEHREWLWEKGTICVPFFYYDSSTVLAHFLASIDKVREALPSSRLHPLRVTPWHCVVTIAAYEYRDTDIGPYNESLIGVPVMLDEPAPLFTGIVLKPPAVPNIYARHLPVTTEIARAAGVDLAGYPKFIADITFEREGNRVSAVLKDGGQHVLTLVVEDGERHPAPRSRSHILTARNGYILRSESVSSERSVTSGRNSGARLELGDHPIADELRSWRLGRLLAYEYAPQHQFVLTPVIESLPV